MLEGLVNMPNWCNNDIQISHTDSAKMDKLESAIEEGNLFSTILPEPDWTNIPNEKGEYSKLEKLPELSITSLRWPDGKQDDRWFGWRNENWGTKWEVTEFYNNIRHENQLTLSFDTAWSPPIAIYEALVNQGYSVRAYYNEPGCDFAGKWEDYEDNHVDSMSEQDDDWFVEDPLGQELEQYYNILEHRAEWC